MEFGDGDKGPLRSGWSRRSMAFRGGGRGGGCRELGSVSWRGSELNHRGLGGCAIPGRAFDFSSFLTRYFSAWAKRQS